MGMDTNTTWIQRRDCIFLSRREYPSLAHLSEVGADRSVSRRLFLPEPVELVGCVTIRESQIMNHSHIRRTLPTSSPASGKRNRWLVLLWCLPRGERQVWGARHEKRRSVAAMIHTCLIISLNRGGSGVLNTSLIYPRVR